MNITKKELSPEEAKLTELITKIQKLIEKSLAENEKWKKRITYLFSQLEAVKNLRNYLKNPQLLQAYLTLMGFYYQNELNAENLTERFVQEVSLVEQKMITEKNETEPPISSAEEISSQSDQFLEKHGI